MGITNGMHAEIISEVKDSIETMFAYGAIGTGTAAFSTADTTLGTEVFRDAVDEVDTSVTETIVVSLRVLTTEANGNDITEAGFLDAASAGNLWTRNVISAITKTTDKQLYLDVQIDVTTEEV